MKAIQIIIGVMIVILLFGAIFLPGIRTTRTDQYEQTNPGITTGEAVTTADITLVKDLWEADLVSVITVSSNNTADTPATSAYDEDTKALTIAGLNASDNRTLTITYEYAVLTGANAPADTFFSIFPLLGGAGLLFLIVMAFWGEYKKRGR